MGTTSWEIGGSQYTPLAVDRLIVGTRLPFNVFAKDGGMIVPLFSKGTHFTSITRDILRGKGIKEVYIQEEDKAALDNYTSGQDKAKSFYDDPAVFKEFSHRKEEHLQIDRTFLVPGTEINFSLFMLNNLNLIPLIDATEKFPAKIDERVLTAKADIVIKNSDIPLYKSFINSLAKSEHIPPAERMKAKAIAVKESSKLLIKDLLDDPRSGEKIKESTVMVSNMTDCILENKDAIYDLVSLSGYDYYTYTHSVNVAVLSVGLGVAIDLKRNDIEKLGIGAMLHDVGKSAIPHEILNKQGHLTNTEYQIMKNHVIEGEKILRTHKAIPDESFTAVLQHHEKLSGKGYPLKLAGHEIKLFGRICAISDCYDALTTRRPYKPAFKPFQALSVVAQETGSYDPELLRTFIKMLGKIK